jgi:hypothetical protein
MAELNCECNRKLRAPKAARRARSSVGGSVLVDDRDGEQPAENGDRQGLQPRRNPHYRSAVLNSGFDAKERWATWQSAATN